MTEKNTPQEKWDTGHCGPPKDFAAAGMRKSIGCKKGIRSRHVKEPPHLRTWRKTASSSGGRNRGEQSRLEGTGKCNDIYWKNFPAGDREASCRNFQRVAKNHELDLVEGSPPSET
jgi:hypothetical protein